MVVQLSEHTGWLNIQTLQGDQTFRINRVFKLSGCTGCINFKVLMAFKLSGIVNFQEIQGVFTLRVYVCMTFKLSVHIMLCILYIYDRMYNV